MIENNIYLGLLLGTACIAVGYVIFGPNLNQPNLVYNKRKRKAIQINGLENNENNCYVNVVVQALCSSEAFMFWLRQSLIQQELFSPNLLIASQQQSAIQFIRYLFSIIFRNNLFYHTPITRSDQQQQIKFSAEKTLTFQLLKLLQDVNGKVNQDTSLNVSKLLEILCNYNFQSRNEQQDAHELFNVLISSLENEILRTVTVKDSLNGIQTNDIQSNDNKQSNDKTALIKLDNSTAKDTTTEDYFRLDGDSINGNMLRTKDNVINISKELNSNEYDTIKKSLDLKRNLPTKGLLAHQMWCLKCDHKFTIQFESFHSISLAIPTIRKLNETITLKDCLNAFVSSEVLQDVVCENCQKLDEQDDASSTRRKSTFVKRLTFAKLPQVFVIHFQRLVFSSNGMPMKKEDRVKFPNLLIMDEYQYEHYAVKQKNGISDALNRSGLNSCNGDRSAVKSSNLFTNLADKLNQSNDCSVESLESSTKSSEVLASSLDDNNLNNAKLSNNDTSKITTSLPSSNHQPNSDIIDSKTTIASDCKTTIDGHISSDSNDSNSNVNDIEPNLTQNEEISERLETTKASENSFVNNTHNTNKTLDRTIASINETTSWIPCDAYSNNIEQSSNKMSSNSIKSSSSDLASTSKPKNAKYKYRLNACIVHLGNSFSGHYVNHRRLPNTSSNNSSNNSDWYFTSDTIVKKSSVEDAMSCRPYMLFYERIK